jgi:N-methylhydantoinase A
MAYRLGIDTGGTHTDLVLIDGETGRQWTAKVPSTPDDPVQAVVKGLVALLHQADVTPGDLTTITYGTTVVVNRIINGHEVTVGLLATAGFTDVLELGRSYRSGNIYDVQYAQLAPLVPRNLRLPVRERVDFRGTVHVALAEDDVLGAATPLRDAGVDAVAICFLHAYVNPHHEQRARDLLERALPGVPVSISSDVSPAIGEYERTSTTVLDAYVKPALVDHLRDFQRSLEELGTDAALLTMQGSGGIMSVEAAQSRPVRVANSGPVAGAIGGAHYARAARIDNAITLDMGGTSTDVAVMVNGELIGVLHDELEGHPIQLPAIEIARIGAGGGSVAWIDEGGALRVGPQSAGAVPGPVCYGLGGQQTTVTDAALVAGWLDPDYYLGGSRQLDLEAAQRAIDEQLAGPLDLDVQAAGFGVLSIAAAASTRAIRRLTTGRGHHPNEFTLVAFGGAGGMVAAQLARELQIPAVVIPPNPGHCSATGLLLTDHRYDVTAAYRGLLDEVDRINLEDAYGRLEDAANTELHREGVEAQQRALQRHAELRYFGQNFELSVPCPSPLGAHGLTELAERFHNAHHERYGYDAQGDPIEVVSIRLVAVGAVDRPAPVAPPKGGSPHAAVRDRRCAYFGDGIVTDIFDRSQLAGGSVVIGPAIVEEPAGTTVVWPGQSLEVAPNGSLIIDIFPERGSR